MALLPLLGQAQRIRSRQTTMEPRLLLRVLVLQLLRVLRIRSRSHQTRRWRVQQPRLVLALELAFRIRTHRIPLWLQVRALRRRRLVRRTPRIPLRRPRAPWTRARRKWPRTPRMWPQALCPPPQQAQECRTQIRRTTSLQRQMQKR